MPYFIADKSPDCSGWATVKADGEVIGCHQTKADAVKQMVAVSLAENMQPGGERNADGPKAIILDIDDTLIHMGEPMQQVIDYVNGLDGRKLIITGRPESEREETVKQLGEIGINYTALFMKGTDEATSTYKGKVAERLLARYNIVLAIDNDETNRRAFSNLGIPTMDPAGIDSENDDQMRWSSISINLNKDDRSPVSKQVERRVSHVDFDVRELDTTGDKMTFRGYAAVFNSPSQPLPFIEYIREGAFQRSLKSRNEIKMFKNHNTDIVLGSTRAGTLRLTEDSTGLVAEADLPPTTDGKDLSILMQRGDVNSMSFGFSVPPRGDAWSEDGQTRELKEVRLHEVSIVTGFPAYEATTASVRSVDFLATRTKVDADALADALTRLEAGEELEAQHADLISEVVTKLRTDKPVEPEFDPQLLELKKKQLDLMAKVF